MLRRYLVDPVDMWWPSNLAQVSLFRSVFLCSILPCSYLEMQGNQFFEMISYFSLKKPVI
jgi:hypothetical protein